ncbi:hypothetical protein D3C81_2003760 [compost metagenome]
MKSASLFSMTASMGSPQRLSTKATRKKRAPRVTTHKATNRARLNWKIPEAMVISLNGIGVSPLIRMTQAPCCWNRALEASNASALPRTASIHIPTGSRK